MFFGDAPGHGRRRSSDGGRHGKVAADATKEQMGGDASPDGRGGNNAVVGVAAATEEVPGRGIPGTDEAATAPGGSCGDGG